MALPCVPGGVYKINWISFLTVKLGDAIQVSGREAARRSRNCDEGRTFWKLNGLFIFLALPSPLRPQLLEFPYCLLVLKGRQGGGEVGEGSLLVIVTEGDAVHWEDSIVLATEACKCVYRTLSSPAPPVTDHSVHSPGSSLIPKRWGQTASRPASSCGLENNP